MHETFSIPCNVGSASFICLGSIPVPWKKILDDEWQHLVECVGMQLCPTPLLCYARDGRGQIISETSNWKGHCHCSQPGSLKCRAFSILVKNFLCEYIQGTGWNSIFWDFRSQVNFKASDSFKYEGSVMFRNYHFIILSCGSIHMSNTLKIFREFEDCIFLRGAREYMIMCCSSCSDGMYSSVKECMIKVKDWIDKGTARLRTYYKLPLPRSLKERYQCRLLRHYLRDGKPFAIWDYNYRPRHGLIQASRR